MKKNPRLSYVREQNIMPLTVVTKHKSHFQPVTRINEKANFNYCLYTPSSAVSAWDTGINSGSTSEILLADE